MTESGFALMLSIPSFTNKAAKSGYNDGACPQMEIVISLSCAARMRDLIAFRTAGSRSLKYPRLCNNSESRSTP